MNTMDSFFDNITEWTSYAKMMGNKHVDFITFWTTKNIQVDLAFARSKSTVYNEKLRDNVMFYAKNLDFINQIETFRVACPEKFVNINEKSSVM